jgi:hypothetical protein
MSGPEGDAIDAGSSTADERSAAAPPTSPEGAIGAVEALDSIALAREAAVCTAQQHLRPAEGVPDRNWAQAQERLRSLGPRMQAQFAAGDWAMRRLRDRLGLDEASCWLVLSCAAVELYPEAALAMGMLLGDDRQGLVTPFTFARVLLESRGIGVAVALSAALSGSAAERLGLIQPQEMASHQPLTQQALRLAPAELRCLLSGGGGTRSASFLVQEEPPARGCGLDERMVRHTAALLAERGVLCVRSASARAGRQLALDLGAVRGETAVLVTPSEELVPLAQLGHLRDGLVVIDLHALHLPSGFPSSYVQELARHLTSLVLLVPWSAATGELATVDAEPPRLPDRHRIWAQEIADPATAEQLARRFAANLEEVRAAVRAARDATIVATGSSGSPDAAAVAEQVLAQGARRMGRLVTRLRSPATLEHLVVPAHVRGQLDDILGWSRASARVYDEWRVAAHTRLGRGLSCLFSGPPGTGKTYAAQCLANALGLNLYCIDLSQVVSKYIGETEKALSTVFDEAEAGHGVLLFDEADALFGKRSEVKDAHDRYANIEVGYLLQRLESFEGVSILTTNLRSNIDPAFTRRLRFVLEFPIPDVAMRHKLWQRSLPSPDRWAEPIDIRVLAERFVLAGGHIHNIGLAAAHLAADSDEQRLRAVHVVRATYRELTKAGLARSRDDFGPLAALVGEVA